MATFDQIGIAEASAELAVAKAIYAQVNFWHRSEPMISGVAQAKTGTLWVTITRLEIGRYDPQKKRSAETGFIEMIVAVGQVGFAYMFNNQRPVTPGDAFEYPIGSGRYFSVMMDEEDGIKQLCNGYVYRLRAKEKKTITLGDKS